MTSEVLRQSSERISSASTAYTRPHSRSKDAVATIRVSQQSVRLLMIHPIPNDGGDGLASPASAGQTS